MVNVVEFFLMIIVLVVFFYYFGIVDFVGVMLGLLIGGIVVVLIGVWVVKYLLVK